MSKKIKKNNGVFYVVISLIAVFAIGTVAFAYSVSNNINVEGDYVYNEAEGQVGDLNLGASPGTRFTVDNLEYGAEVSGYLDFTAGSTSTPGGLFSIVNYGPTKICDKVEIDITTASQVGGFLGTGAPLMFSVATSTAAGIGAGDGLLTTSTVPTTTTMLLDSDSQPGNSLSSFLWETATVINGSFEELDTQAATSSDVYTGMVGRYYIRCHER